MEEREVDVYVSEEDIAKFVWDRLLAKGYVPQSDEILDLAEIFFDYLLDKAIVDFEEEV